MELIATAIPRLPTARNRGAPSRSPSLHPHVARDEAKLSSCNSEVPDPKYWTAYDFHMIERDARARRRAHVYSMVATLWKRLRQRIFDIEVTA